jgi:hypothetical protein
MIVCQKPRTFSYQVTYRQKMVLQHHLLPIERATESTGFFHWKILEVRLRQQYLEKIVTTTTVIYILISKRGGCVAIALHCIIRHCRTVQISSTCGSRPR